MTVKKKFTLLDGVKWLAGIIAFVGGAWFIVEATVQWGKFQEHQTEVTFPDSETRVKVISHTNEVPNAVENYKAMVENKAIKVELDTLFAFVNAVFEEDIARIKADSLNSASAINSRATRDSLNVKNQKDIAQIQREQMIITNTMQVILQKVKELKQNPTE